MTAFGPPRGLRGEDGAAGGQTAAAGLTALPVATKSSAGGTVRPPPVPPPAAPAPRPRPAALNLGGLLGYPASSPPPPALPAPPCGEPGKPSPPSWGELGAPPLLLLADAAIAAGVPPTRAIRVGTKPVPKPRPPGPRADVPDGDAPLPPPPPLPRDVRGALAAEPPAEPLPPPPAPPATNLGEGARVCAPVALGDMERNADGDVAETPVPPPRDAAIVAEAEPTPV
mmetsp:Transcript_118244/g.376937  ORF Transcript_118244/g.376937 Transcript_118244/m.376937 type:complete len:227 (+) Transcript_118244:183-863(+)